MCVCVAYTVQYEYFIVLIIILHYVKVEQHTMYVVMHQSGTSEIVLHIL